MESVHSFKREWIRNLTWYYLVQCLIQSHSHESYRKFHFGMLWSHTDGLRAISGISWLQPHYHLWSLPMDLDKNQICRPQRARQWCNAKTTSSEEPVSLVGRISFPYFRYTVTILCCDDRNFIITFFFFLVAVFCLCVVLCAVWGVSCESGGDDELRLCFLLL